MDIRDKKVVGQSLCAASPRLAIGEIFSKLQSKEFRINIVLILHTGYADFVPNPLPKKENLAGLKNCSSYTT
jgi:hypothetical protein